MNSDGTAVPHGPKVSMCVRAKPRRGLGAAPPTAAHAATPEPS
jgi:hypothetical protein